MRHSFALGTVAVLLTGCASYAAATPTAVPTETATLTPTSTLTPTPTPDPNMPSGATGKNSQGEWTKTDNTITYTWKVVRYGSAPGSHFDGWFRIGTIDPNGIFLFDKREMPGFTGSFVKMHVYFADNPEHSAPLIYVDHPAEFVQLDPKGGSFCGYLLGPFYKAMGGKVGPQFYDMWNELIRGNLQGKYDIIFTDQDGVQHRWNPSKGYTFYQIPWEAADPELHAGFHENGDSYNSKVFLRWAVTTDADGALIGLGAAPDINALTAEKYVNHENIEQLVVLILAPFAEAIIYRQLPSYKKGLHFEQTVEDVGYFGNTARFGTPHFVVVRH